MPQQTPKKAPLNSTSLNLQNDPVVIISMGCRFPQADNLEQFWQILSQGKDVIRPVPQDRWDIESFYDADFKSQGRIHQAEGGFLDHVKDFDPAYFHLSRREALHMDPQQRLLLECVVQAAENSGLKLSDLRQSKTGVFVGISTHDYNDILQSPSERENISPYTNQGGSLAIAANRISYVFDFHGPSLAIDTACSSSLYALRAAASSLRDQDCDFAFIGGVNVNLKPEMTIGFSKGNYLSPTSRCRAFSAEADGYVRSEGAGVLFLTRKSIAEENKLPILAEVLAVSANEDGKTEGMALPNPEAQKRLLAEALKKSGLTGAQIDYVECHGTGTPAGDPIECRGVGAIYGVDRKTDHPCLIGSVKTNIGHLEAGSGVAGLIKLVLSMHKGIIPASLHSENLNPAIPFGDLNLQVVRESRKWPENPIGRVGGINSFGFGGANAHAILRAAPTPLESTPTPPLQVPTMVALSGVNEGAVKQQAEQFQRLDAVSLPDLGFTSLQHRDHYRHRALVIAQNSIELKERLEALKQGQAASGLVTGASKSSLQKIGFVFSGQGPQWYKMGRELLACDAIFAQSVREIDQMFRPKLGWSVWDALHREEADARMEETEIAQPTVFALQVSLAKRLLDLGLVPSGVTGHSLGEMAAAVISGAITLEEGVDIIYHRSRLHQTASGRGRMLAASLTPDQAYRYAEKSHGHFSVAAINSADAVAFSGDNKEIQELSDELTKLGIFNRLLRGKVPFHSHHMDPFKDELLRCLSHLKPQKEKIDFYSSTFGKKIPGTTCTNQYWVDCVREPVRFMDSLNAMIDAGIQTFIEISPHPVLSPSIETNLKNKSVAGVALPTLRREQSDVITFYSTIGKLFCEGYTIRPSQAARFIPLPHYPFQRETLWMESAEGERLRLGRKRHPHLSSLPSVVDASAVHTEIVNYNPFSHSYLQDHIVQGTLVVPGATHLDLMMSVNPEIYDVHFDRAYFAPLNESQPLPQGRLEIIGEEKNLKLQSRADQKENTEWTTHVRARYTPTGQSFKEKDLAMPLHSLRWEKAEDLEGLYQSLSDAGLALGDSFRNIQDLWTSSFENEPVAIARISASDLIKEDLARHTFHGALADSCLQAMLFLSVTARRGQFAVYVPTSLAEGKNFRKAKADLFCVVRLGTLNDEKLSGDFWIFESPQNLKQATLNEIIRSLQAGELKKVSEFHDFAASYLDGSRKDSPLDQLEILGRWVAQDRADQVKNRSAQNIWTAWKQIQTRIQAKNEDPRQAELFQTYAAQIEPALNSLAIDFLKQVDTRSSRLNEAQRKWLQNIQKKAPFAPTFSAAQVLQIRQENPEFEMEFQLLENCGRIWLSPEAESLFSGENQSLLHRFYRDSFSNRPYNQLAAEVLQALVDDLPLGKSLRILEIGAGTGGLTQALLPRLPKDRTTYAFTDISSSFFQKAQDDFAAYPFIEYKTFDLEKDFAAQGFDVASFDLIIASNALHTAHNLNFSLQNIGSLLSSQGRLMLLEVTQAPLWVDTIFGLAEGWWNFASDPSFPRSHASLSPQAWRETLQGSGFVQAKTFEPTSLMALKSRQPELCSQSVILGELQAKPLQAESVPLLMPTSVILDPGTLGDRFWSEIKTGSKSATRHLPTDRPDSVLSASDSQQVIHFLSVESFKLDTWDSEQAMQKFHLHMQSLRKWCLHLLETGKNLKYRLVLAGDSPFMASILGAARVLLSELPRLDFGIIQIDADLNRESLQSLFMELHTPSDEGEVSLTQGERKVYRVTRIKDDVPLKQNLRTIQPENFRYTPSKSGLSETGSWIENQRPELRENEMEVEVRALGLNFRDVMLTTGMMREGMIYSGLLGDQIGMECAGLVTKVGANVKDFKVGDRIAACAQGTAAKYAKVQSDHAAQIPDFMSFDEAATLPVVMLTAWEAIITRGQLQEGESVLIHAATGGVGQAAVQIALLQGATVYATAGSEEKRKLLLDQGVTAVFNSRDLQFSEQLLKATNGRGVDLVLNSLSGKAIEHSFRTLAPYGRFIEIGKVDIYDENRISLYPFRKNLSYFAVDIDAALQDRPTAIRKSMRQIFALVAEKKLTALPFQSFPLGEINQAMQVMARSAHIGKLVLSHGPTQDSLHPIPVQTNFSQHSKMKADRTYLISGGSGGIGLVLARWLADKGAKHIALLSPSGERKPEVKSLCEDLRRQAVQIQAWPCDISDGRQLENTLSQIKQNMPGIAGVFHGAMVLDDAEFLEIDEKRFDLTMRPKAIGAMELHLKTLNEPLDWFIMFSSASAAFGNPRQANYNAANLFLEGLSRQRQKMGLPASTVQLGVVGGVGFVARNKNVAQAFERVGWRLVHINEILHGLEKVIVEQPAVRCLADANWKTVSDGFASDRVKKRLEKLIQSENTAGASGSGSSNLFEKALQAPESPEAFEAVAQGLEKELVKILASGGTVSRTSPITEFGLDSLMITQLRYWIQSNLKVDITLMQLMQGPSVESLSKQILQILATRTTTSQNEAANSWILPGFQNPEAKMRLFCFAYMGGASSQIFGPWQNLVHKDIELCLVALPGSMDRAAETPIEDFKTLIKTLVQQLSPLCDKPFAVYGHSQGALIGFEWLREMKRTHQHEHAKQLIVGAYPAPQLPRPFREVTSLPEALTDVIPEALEKQIDLFGLSEALRKDQGLKKALWPGLKAGFRLTDSYQFQAGNKLDVPLTVMAGSLDPAFSVSELKPWFEQTSDGFEFLICEGAGHLFVDSHRHWLIKELNRILLSKMTSA